MKTFKVLLAVAVLGFFSTVSFAQGRGKGQSKGQSQEMHGHGNGHDGDRPEKSPEMRAQNRTAWMVKQLSLSGQQETQVYNVLLTSFTKEMDIRQNVKGDDRKPLLKEIRDKREESLKAILTPQQYAQLQKIREEKRQKGERDDDDAQEMQDDGRNTTEPATQNGAVKGQTTTSQSKGKK